MAAADAAGLRGRQAQTAGGGGPAGPARGVHLALSANPQSFRTGARGCCTVEDSRDARR
ncbi:tRNA 2-thiouridine(34) synthase MnmA, partial [Streptomyces sp. NPDC006999]